MLSAWVRGIARHVQRGQRRLLSSSSSASSASSAADAAEGESLSYDVVIAGAGPAGLSAAIRLKQLQPETSVCVLEKGSEIGAHVLSGNCFEPRALDELLPGWREDASAPIKQPVTEDRFEVLLSDKLSVPLPVPPQMHNEGNYVVSLSEVTRWLGEKAEEVGVETYAGFAGKRLLVKEDASAASDGGGGVVGGIETNAFGVAKDGSRKDTYEPGVAIEGRFTLLAEGCRGSLTKEASRRFALGAHCEPQTYALGLKEVWRVAPEKHRPGFVKHTVGWPLDERTYGGSFIYHMGGDGNPLVALGYVVALDYRNPYMSPYQEFQRWKLHPSVRALLDGGEVIQYGARALNEGGWQSVPKLAFPGGALIGCAAGFLNVPKIKGTHTAMKSGMLAAEACARALATDGDSAARRDALQPYEDALRSSWVRDELHAVRNVRPGFKWGLWGGLLNAAWDTYVMRGRAPYTLSHAHADHQATRPAATQRPIEYPKPDGKITFDLLSNLALSGTNHDHDEPSHLLLNDASLPTRVNVPEYDGPEQRYCPAKVYEYVDGRLQINAQNCLHCKACDIKDPRQNIEWSVPQGGDGPKYTVM